MGSNTVDIYFKGHESGLREAIRRVKSDIQSLRGQRIELTVDVEDRSLRRLQDQMNSVRNTVTQIRTAVDRSELTRLRSELAALRDRTIRVDVELNNAGALAGLAAFDAARGNAHMALDLDTAGAASELAAFIASIPRSVTINLDVDTRTAANELAAFRLALRALNSDTIDLGAASRTASRGIGAVGSSAGKVAPMLLALAPAVGVLASGAVGAGIFGTAAALGAVTAAAGLVSVGFGTAIAALPIMAAATSEEVKGHFKFMADDVVNTMKQIAVPLQTPLVNLATAVGAAFHQIRPNLENITNGVAGLINELSGKMPAIAAEVGPALESLFDGAVPHIQSLMNELPALIASFGDFGASLGDPAIVQGAQRVFGMIPGIVSGAGDALVGVGEKFNDMMAYLDSGALDGFTSGIGQFISNIQSTDWSGVGSGLTDMANSFGDFAGTVDMDQLAGGIENITSALTNLTDGATAVVGAVQGINDAFSDLTGGGSLFDTLKQGMGFGNVWEGLFDNASKEKIPPPEIEPFDPTALSGAFANLVPPSIPAPPIEPPAPLPPMEQPLTLGPMPAVPTPAAVPVPLAPEPMPAPEPPLAPVVIETQAELTNLSQPDIPPLKVPVEYDTAALNTLTIQPPPPVKVPIEFEVTPPDMSAFTLDLTAQGAAAGASFAAGLAGSAGAVAAAAASMAAAAQNVSVDLSGQGAAAGASFAAGIRSQAGAVAAAAAELGRIAAANKGHYKGRKGIAADRIMLIPHGQAMVKGFIGGMQSQKRDLVHAAQGLAGDVYTAFDDDLVPNIGLSGGMDMTQKVYVTVEAGVMADPVKIGREITNSLDAYKTAVGHASGTVVSV